MKKRRALIPALLILATLFISSQGRAADFSVTPVRIFFAPGETTGYFTVSNNAEETLSLQLSAVSWSQDSEGTDVFEPTAELIVFPRIFSLKGKEERIVRVGVKVPPGEMEQAYRVFLEEMPEPESEAGDSTVLRTLVRVGVPVFVSPLKEKVSAEIQDIEAQDGTLSFKVSNTGNVHFIIQAAVVEGTDASGNTIFKKELSGWYLHGGKSRRFSTEIPAEGCSKVTQITINVATNKISLDRRLDAPGKVCPK